MNEDNTRLDMEALGNAIPRLLSGYLQEEMGLEVQERLPREANVRRVRLRDVTSVISLKTEIEMFVAFSFDESLIQKVFAIYADGIEVSEEDLAEAVAETAGDICNLVVGNATAALTHRKLDIELSPPLLLREATWITRQRNGCLQPIEMEGPCGSLTVAIVFPRLETSSFPQTEECEKQPPPQDEFC